MTKSELTAACVFWGAASSVALANPTSNEQVVISAVAAEIDSLIPSAADATLNIVTDSAGLRGLISDGLAEGLKDKYAQVTFGPAPDSSSDNLFYDILGFDFEYEKGSSRGFLRGKNLRREMRCELRITIKSGSYGVLRRAGNLSVDYGDEIARSDIRFVSSRDIPELAIDPPGSSWARYVEPSLVVASVGALVYLFFANR